jgi:hypothetical protein
MKGSKESGFAGDTAERVSVPGSKSKSCVGLLKTPPNTNPRPALVAFAFFEMWIWVGESTLMMLVLAGITVVCLSA